MPVVPFIPAIVGAAGVAATVKGQSDQKKATAKANAQTQGNFDEQQATNLHNYLLSRGTDNTNGRAVNTMLPLWATVKRKPYTATVR